MERTKRFTIDIKIPSLKSTLCVLAAFLVVELGAQIARYQSKRDVLPEIIKLAATNQENIKERKRVYEELLKSGEECWHLAKQHPENPEYSLELRSISRKLESLGYIKKRQEKLESLAMTMISDHHARFPATFYFPRILINEARAKRLTNEMKGKLTPAYD